MNIPAIRNELCEVSGRHGLIAKLALDAHAVLGRLEEELAKQHPPAPRSASEVSLPYRMMICPKRNGDCPEHGGTCKHSKPHKEEESCISEGSFCSSCKEIPHVHT